MSAPVLVLTIPGGGEVQRKGSRAEWKIQATVSRGGEKVEPFDRQLRRPKVRKASKEL